jgi:hypothetical protein
LLAKDRKLIGSQTLGNDQVLYNPPLKGLWLSRTGIFQLRDSSRQRLELPEAPVSGVHHCTGLPSLAVAFPCLGRTVQQQTLLKDRGMEKKWFDSRPTDPQTSRRLQVLLPSLFLSVNPILTLPLQKHVQTTEQQV